MKKFICILIAALLVIPLALGGCGAFSGKDGKNGQDLNIYDVYSAANAAREEEGLPQLSFLDFLKEYLNYDFQYSDSSVLQSFINRSLLSCVSILSVFNEDTYAGSGVIVELDKDAGDAYILTNCHVVYDDAYSRPFCSEIYIYLYANDAIDISINHDRAQIVGASITYDLALLKVENSSLIRESNATAAQFAPEEEVYAGAQVYAVGNPEGLGLSATTGIVSRDSEEIALNLSSIHANDERYFSDYRVIRTDAAINAGNSGGGLFDSSGRLIGIVNSKIVSQEVDNMGYALAGSYVKRIVKLFKDGYSAGTGSYGLRHAVFPTSYDYRSSAYFDGNAGVVKIEDKVIVTRATDQFNKGDVVLAIKITDGSGKVVEEMDITRYFNLDDALLSVRDGYTITYTILSNGTQRTVETRPSFTTCN